MYKTIRPWLFRLNPEFVHALTLQMLRFSGKIQPLNEILRKYFFTSDEPVNAFGLSFKNPIGLAAGYDKDGIAWRGLKSLGFSHIEIGTVTLEPQSGNPKPRLFRLPEDQALVNRLGFPSRGSEFVLRQLTDTPPDDLIIGVNIGKNKETPLEEASSEYTQLLRLFTPTCDYIVINVSSPNTIGLRRLQARDALDDLLKSVEIERSRFKKRKPVLVKLSPDMTEAELADSLEVITENKIDGVIAANTTVSRPDLKSMKAIEAGGLSGIPLWSMSVKMVEKIYYYTGGEMPIIGVGGVSEPSSARAMLDAGAVLVQIYTALVYEGPGLVKSLLRGLKST